MSRKRGFSLVELLVVVSILAAIAAVLLPAIQSARESARACTCRDNLRQIGIATLQFESANGHFPMGAEGRFNRELWPSRTYGFSWWPQLLPYLEHQDIADQLDWTGVSIGWVQNNSHNGSVADGLALSVWFCPSSEIDRLVSASQFRVAAPSYTGISGATNFDGFSETRVSECCRSDGEISSGGILIPNAVVGTKQITDGVSNTILVGEQSDFAIKKDGTRWRVDAGYPNGWLCGTTELNTPPKWSSSLSVAYNLATIRYPLNEKRYDLPGIYLDRGANNPLVSPHPTIVHLLYGDGSVHALGDSMDTFVLKLLATRDDGIVRNN